MTPAELVAFVRDTPIVTGTNSQPAQCYAAGCKADTHLRRHLAGSFGAMLAFCPKHEAVVDAVLRDPASWSA